MTYKQTLGDWGEDVAAQLLVSSGFTDIAMLNDGHRNRPGGDILANKDGAKYFFSVKARDRFMKNGAINWGYNIYPEKVRHAAMEFAAIPAWLVVRADRRNNSYCVYWGLIDELPKGVSVSMRDKHTPSYRCLARDVPCPAIADIFSDKEY
jgi:Holliday junction resolvase-like predicted endonuclease